MSKMAPLLGKEMTDNLTDSFVAYEQDGSSTG